MHTLLYIKPYFWCLVPVADSMVPVEEVPPWCRLLTPWCRWLPTWCQWWRCLPGASGGGASLVPVCLDHSGLAVAYIRPAPWQERTEAHQCGGALASESKLQGEIDRCDYSYYQLFRCSFWVCFYGAVCMLKR